MGWHLSCRATKGCFEICGRLQMCLLWGFLSRCALVGRRAWHLMGAGGVWALVYFQAFGGRMIVCVLSIAKVLGGV